MAAEEIKKNRVSIGDSPVKSSKEVKVGDVIKVRRNQIDYKIKVLEIPKSRIGAKLVAEHVTDLTDKEQYEILKLRKQQQDYYRIKGEGRPTKKDRREIDDYLTVGDSSVEINDEDYWDGFFNNDKEEDE